MSDEKVNELEHRMEQLEEHIDNMEQMLKRIDAAITGDHAYGIAGYRQKIENNTKSVKELREATEELQTFKQKIMWYALGGATAGGGFVNILLKFVQ